MSISKGLVGFGMSVIAAGAGSYFLHEAYEADTKGNQVIACQKNLAHSACHDVVVSNLSVDTYDSKTTVYGWAAGISLIGAGIGAAVSFSEALDD